MEKYRSSYDEKYCYPGTNVLKYKLLIKEFDKLQEYECKVSAMKNADLQKTPMEGNLDFKHLKAIHQFLFE